MQYIYIYTMFMQNICMYKQYICILLPANQVISIPIQQSFDSNSQCVGSRFEKIQFLRFINTITRGNFELFYFYDDKNKIKIRNDDKNKIKNKKYYKNKITNNYDDMRRDPEGKSLHIYHIYIHMYYVYIYRY